jgi:hypothetical protein
MKCRDRRGAADSPFSAGFRRSEPETKHPRLPVFVLVDGENCLVVMVARAGVEPATFRFSGGRSYQLSYLAVAEHTVLDSGVPGACPGEHHYTSRACRGRSPVGPAGPIRRQR